LPAAALAACLQHGNPKNTRVSGVLREYGDLAEVMEAFGVRRVGGIRLRRFLGRFLTVERAARVHRVPLEQFLDILRRAVASRR
jgi:hypothetical protein